MWYSSCMSYDKYVCPIQLELAEKARWLHSRGRHSTLGRKAHRRLPGRRHHGNSSAHPRPCGYHQWCFYRKTIIKLTMDNAWHKLNMCTHVLHCGWSKISI